MKEVDTAEKYRNDLFVNLLNNNDISKAYNIGYAQGMFFAYKIIEAIYGTKVADEYMKLSIKDKKLLLSEYLREMIETYKQNKISSKE